MGGADLLACLVITSSAKQLTCTQCYPCSAPGADPLVETASLASIPLPALTFQHALRDCVEQRLLSDAQLETIVRTLLRVWLCGHGACLCKPKVAHGCATVWTWAKHACGHQASSVCCCLLHDAPHAFAATPFLQLRSTPT